MKSLKRRGPRTEPWGLSEVVASQLEHLRLSSTTDWVLPVRYEKTQKSTVSENPGACNLISNLEWHTVSKALLKSNSTRIVT